MKDNERKEKKLKHILKYTYRKDRGPITKNTKEDSPLTGMYFINYKKPDMLRAGKIDQKMGDNYYYKVSFFSWISGLLEDSEIVHVHNMEGWLFYEDRYFFEIKLREYMDRIDKKYIKGVN